MISKWVRFFLFDCVLMNVNEVFEDKIFFKVLGYMLKFDRILVYEWYRVGKKFYLKEFFILVIIMYIKWVLKRVLVLLKFIL